MIRNAAWAALLVLLSHASQSVAQDFRQGAPQQLPRLAPVLPTPPMDRPSAPGDGAALVVPLLLGLVFVGAAADVVPNGVKPPAGGIDVRRVPILDQPAFLESLKTSIGKPATLADLNRIVGLAIAAHRAAGRPLVDVAVPEQDVSGGVIQIVVAEYRVGDVLIEGNRHFSTPRLRNAIRLQSGDVVAQPDLVEDLNWLQQNPFRRVEVIYRPSVAPLTTDIVVHVNDRLPLRIYAGFDNSGPPNTQRERVFVGLNWGNVLGGDGQFSYQATASRDLFSDRKGPSKAFEAHSFTLLQPLPARARDTLLLFGTVQRAAPDFGDNLGQIGKNLQVSGRWNRTLDADPAYRLTLAIGWDFKQSDNNLLFGGSSISRQVTEIQQAIIEASGSFDWLLGRLATVLSLAASPGGIGNRNSDAAFQPSADHSGTPFATARYLYARLTIGQTTPLPGSKFEARTRLIGQLSSANLLPSEQLSAAGLGAIRGYDPNSVIGSQGFLASQELWLPPLNLARRLGRAELGAFVEAAQVGNIDRTPTEPKWTRTAAAGLSASLTVGAWVNLRADYGWQLRALAGAAKGSLGTISANIGF